MLEYYIKGLLACYVEGMTYLQMNRRHKRALQNFRRTSATVIKRSTEAEMRVSLFVVFFVCLFVFFLLN